MPRYNGHLNWNYWNVSLWINNEEGLYRLALNCVKRNRTKTEAAKQFVELLSSSNGLAPKTRDGAVYTIPSVRAAMSEM